MYQHFTFANVRARFIHKVLTLIHNSARTPRKVTFDEYTYDVAVQVADLASHVDLQSCHGVHLSFLVVWLFSLCPIDDFSMHVNSFGAWLLL